MSLDRNIRDLKMQYKVMASKQAEVFYEVSVVAVGL